MPIKVHIACDDPSYRDAIANLLTEDKDIEVAETSGEAEPGAAAVKRVKPDVVVLAVPPSEEVRPHAEMYLVSAPPGTAIVGFCTTEQQAAGYRAAGIDVLVFPADTDAALQESVKAAHHRSSRNREA
jgi:chemotaxis response regulator CheB